MKKLIFCLFTFSLFFACGQQDESEKGVFNIDGTISSFDSSYVYLKKVSEGELITIDSTLVSETKFSFSGSVEFAELYYLSFGDKKDVKKIFLDNSQITFNAQIDSLENAVIKGSKAHEEFQLYNDEMSPFNNKMKDLGQQYRDAKKENNEALLKEIDSTYEALDEDQVRFINNYIGTHKNSVITPYIIKRELAYRLSVNELDSVLSILDSTLKVSPYVVSLRERVEILRNVEVGKVAPDFTINDTTGTPVTMSSFKGKYLLIDFWASWCGPCRRDNPDNVLLYADYKDKGFEILGVSFDDKNDKWVEAIHKDGLTWPHVSELKGWKSDAGKLYGVNSIPHTVLLDKEGVIIAKNLGGEELRAKVAEILD